MLRWALGICIIYLRCIKNRNSSNTPTTTTNYYWPIFRQCSFYVSLVIFAVPINISILRLLANACYDNISIIHDHDSYERINVWMCVSSRHFHKNEHRAMTRQHHWQLLRCSVNAIYTASRHARIARNRLQIHTHTHSSELFRFKYSQRIAIAMIYQMEKSFLIHRKWIFFQRSTLYQWMRSLWQSSNLESMPWYCTQAQSSTPVRYTVPVIRIKK